MHSSCSRQAITSKMLPKYFAITWRYLLKALCNRIVLPFRLLCVRFAFALRLLCVCALRVICNFTTSAPVFSRLICNRLAAVSRLLWKCSKDALRSLCNRFKRASSSLCVALRCPAPAMHSLRDRLAFTSQLLCESFVFFISLARSFGSYFTIDFLSLHDHIKKISQTRKQVLCIRIALSMKSLHFAFALEVLQH
jgi:hypothetical protein